MKRIFIYLLILAMGFGFVAFQCSSTELTSAKLYIQQKNMAKAKESLENEVAKNPKSDEGYYLLGYVFGEEGETEKMLENFSKSLEISKKFEQNIKDSRKYHWAENFNKGVANFNKATKTDDQDSIKMFFERAIGHFDLAIMCEPDSADTYKNLIFAYKNEGLYDKTIEPYEKIMSLNYSDAIAEEYSETLLFLGNEATRRYQETNDPSDSLKAKEYWMKAIDVIEKRLPENQENTTMIENLFKLYQATGGYEPTLEKVDQKIAENPNNKVYYYVKGVLLLGKNKYEESLVPFNKAIEIDPDYTDALFNSGIAYFNWGAKLFNESLEKEEEDLSYKEKFESAKPIFEKYIELEPEDPSGWESLAKIYTQLGDTEKAEEAFNKADQLRQ
jgi:tetratricopeptide (TPR) repeat protein